LDCTLSAVVFVSDCSLVTLPYLHVCASVAQCVIVEAAKQSTG